ncbi:MAG: discoidin domain-containing protein [Eubacteriales bacterium]|nr:discoidin domain-containing protein [Eubacteriales bacterium]
MKRYPRRAAAAFLSFAMGMSSLSGTAFGAPMMMSIGRSSGDSDTQMVSEKERVYVSRYDGSERSQDFNDNWRFYLGDAGSAAGGTSFDDSGWDSVTLPHDYSIEQEYSKNMEAESAYLPGGTGWYRKTFTVPQSAAGMQTRIDFDGVYMNATVYINGREVGSHPYGYSPFSFDLTQYLNYGGENVIAVKVDHKTPSSRWYSGSGIYRDVKLTMTPMVHEALHGTRITTPDIEQGNGTVQVKTEIVNDSGNTQEATVTYKIYKKGDSEKTAVASGTAGAVTLSAGASETVTAELSVDAPELWNIDDPNLYVLETSVTTSSGSDVSEADFGFRYFKFDSSEGFFLNGEPVKLKGVCMHHDQGSLGSEAWTRAIERQVEILKQMGCNAIRVTHNPAAQALIDICNEKGMLVIEEMFDGWTDAKNGNSHDYSEWFSEEIGASNAILGKESGSMTWAEFDLKAVIARDYNAPSIISWSLGNEIIEGTSSGGAGYPEQAKKLITWAQEIDTTRPITTGDNKIKSGNSYMWSVANALHESGGIVGFNYANIDKYDTYHSTYPDYKFYGSETASSINSRGVYNTSNYSQELTSYDESAVSWGHVASQAWFDTIRRDFLAGEFVWTGFDYLGEPTTWNGTGAGVVGTWPSPKNSFFGIIDTAGFPKDSYYLYQSLWNDDVNTLHILPAWENEIVKKDSSGNVNVVVYSDAPTVELFFTPAGSEERQSLGSKTMTTLNSQADSGKTSHYTYQMYLENGSGSDNHKNLYRTWSVPYADGTLTAVATDENGNEITDTDGRSQVTTFGEPAQLAISADREAIDADGKDLVYVTVDVLDENGEPVADAENRVTFSVEGNGKLLSVDNGRSQDHDSYQADNRRAFSGKVLAIVQSTDEAGSFTVTASADGLASASVDVDTEAVEKAPETEQQITSYEISKNYYVKVGNAPELPDTLTVYYSDGESAEREVTWESVNDSLYEQEGSFLIKGTVEDTAVSVSINMMDNIAAVLNYSTTVRKGEAPILPQSRQIVSEDGEVLNISLPVEWEEKDASEFAEEGIVTVNGTVTAFGEPVAVTASVRVQEEENTITDNVATKAKVSQNIPKEYQSDTLSAINDGSTASTESQDSNYNNLSRWSNWNWTYKGNQDTDPAQLTFTYDTQEVLGQAKIYFVENGADLRLPDAGQTKWYISNDMETWTELATEETIADATTSQYVTCYTYDFAPVQATYLRIEIHNSTTADVASGKKPTTGITEVELYRSEGKFVAKSDTGLSRLVVNGTEVSSSALNEGSYNTPMAVIEEIEAEGKNNAAVTILPEKDGVVRILTEAEDHSERDTFLINLGAESELGADDASMDYPLDKLTVSASSEETVGEQAGMARAIDGDTSTFWHTKWKDIASDYVDELWLQVELEDDDTTLDAVRYLPRQTSHNGRVNGYEVSVSDDGETWEIVATGNWASDTQWVLAEFDTPVKAKFVKLHATSTYGDTANKFMSAAEFRVRTGRETTELTEETATVTLDQDIYELGEDGAAVKPQVTVELKDGTKLRYGIDYTLSYENNDEPGIATVTVKGIVNYSGKITVEYKIISDKTQEITVEGGTITKIDGEAAEGESTASVESGRELTVTAEAAEGRVFDHWRAVPANLLTEAQTTEEEVSFIVPQSRVRLVAVTRGEDEEKLQEEAYSTASPADWFAYADEAEMAELLEAALDDDDRFALSKGGTVSLTTQISRTATAPSKQKVFANYIANAATPSDAKRENSDADDELTATPSAAARLRRAARTASNSEAERETETEGINYKSLMSAAPAPMTAVKEELGIAEDKELAKQIKLAFWVSTETEKTTKYSGNTKTVNLTDKNLPTYTVTMELPEKNRDMEHYGVYAYMVEEEDITISTVACEVEGDLLKFEASPEGLYAVTYTQCYDVIFEDWDGTVISKQRVPYGMAAEAPEDPVREGYVFTGWNKDFDEITANLTVRAQYEKAEEEKTADKTKLQSKIREVTTKLETLKEEDYTEESWQTLMDALTDAEAVVEDENATQKEVNNALSSLAKALSGLKKNPEEEKPGKPHSSGGSSGGGSSTMRRAVPEYYTSGNWSEGETGWTFRLTDGTAAVSRWIYTNWNREYGWYFFDENGLMKTGWIELDGETYYLNPESEGIRGRMITGWKQIEGKWYYFSDVSDGKRGRMLKGTETPDGYQVGADGVWVQ